MKLVDLQNKANEGYPDGMGDYYDKETGNPTNWHTGDSLEWFVHIEIAETYESEASDLEQVREARRVIERGIEDLESVANALYKLECETEAESLIKP